MFINIKKRQIIGFLCLLDKQADLFGSEYRVDIRKNFGNNVESQNDRMVWLGRGHKGYQVLVPYNGQ